MEKNKLHVGISNDDAVASSRFWVPLSAWHVLPCLHGFSPGSPVLFYCPKSCGWGTGALASSLQLRSVLPLDGVVTRPGCLKVLKWMSGLVPVTQTDGMRESSCYTPVPLDGSKHHTMIAQRLFVLYFSFLTAHDKLFTFYSLPVTHLTFYQLLGCCQGDVIRTWCHLWYIQYELQTLVQSRWFFLKKLLFMHFSCSVWGGIMNQTKNEWETHLLF